MNTARKIAHLWLSAAAATLLLVAEEAKPKPKRRKPRVVQEAPWWERV